MPEWVQAAAVRQALRMPRDWIGGLGLVVWRRKLPILVCVGLALASTAAYVSTLRPAYEAEALVAPGDRPGQQIGPSDPLRMMDTRAVAEQLVERLDLQLLPEFHPDHSSRSLPRTALTMIGPWLPAELVRWLGNGSLNTLATRPSERPMTDEERAARLRDAVIQATVARMRAELTASSAIGLKFIAEDPQLAAAGANTLADLYLEQRPGRHPSAARSERGKLDQEIESLRADIRATEQAIETARGSTDAQASGTSGQNRLDWTGELAFWRRERAEVEARLRQVQAALDSGAELTQTAPSLNSDRLRQVQNRTIELRQALTELSQRNGERDPQIVGLRAELAALEQDRRAELEQIVQGLRGEIEIIQSRETALEEKIQTPVAESTAGPVADRLSALEQKLAADRALLRDRLKQAPIQAEAQPSAPEGDARIIRPAVAPNQPAYPRLALIWGVAAAASLALGVVVAFVLEALHGARA